MVKSLKRTTPVGLDLGDTALRAAQLRRDSDRYVVCALAQLARGPENAKQPVSFSADLRRLFQGAPFRGKTVISALNPPEVEFHVLDLPKAALQDGASADQVIHWEIGRLTSLSSDQLETRHWLLPSRPGASASAIGVSVTRDAVLRLLRVCGESGLKCSGVDTGATALHRFGRLLKNWAPTEIWGVLDLGGRQSRLVLCTNDAPILIRHTGSGGQSWTERIAEVLQISQAAAETQKRTHGIALAAQRESRKNAEIGAQDEVAVMLLGALRSELNELASEIKRSYEYVLGSYPGKRAADLVLVGGGATMPHLAEFLSSNLGIAVHSASHYQSDANCRLNLNAACRDGIESYAIAIGLSLSEEAP